MAPPRLQIARKLSARSDRVKSLDLHPTEPWVLACLYSGKVVIYNYETSAVFKTFEVTENMPVRCGKVRKQGLFLSSTSRAARFRPQISPPGAGCANSAPHPND